MKKIDKAGTTYLDELMIEVDANVRELVDTFRFLLKYIILFSSSGVEFAGLREYVPGHDDATRIDWKASLRTNKMYVKQFEDERDLDVYILLDTSSSMLFGTQEKLKSEYATVVAGTLAYSAVESGDNIGFAMFNDNIHSVLDPLGDISQYYKILQLAVDPKNYGGGCGLTKALSNLVNILDNRTVLFIISDFIGIDKGWDDALRMMAGKIDMVMGLMVRDVRDSFIPEGVGKIRLSDPFSDKILTIDLDKTGEEFNRLAREQERKIEQVFLNGGMSLIKMYTNEPFVKPLVRHIELMDN